METGSGTRRANPANVSDGNWMTSLSTLRSSWLVLSSLRPPARPILPFPHPSGCSASSVEEIGGQSTPHRKRWLGELGWLTEFPLPLPLPPSPPTWRRSLIASPDLALLKLPALAGGVATWQEPGPPSPGGGSYSQG